MKVTFLSLFFLTLSIISSASVPPYIISGLDDVIRQAENTGLVKAAVKILESDKTFSGMTELYKIISREEKGVSKFIVLSGISHFFDERMKKFIDQAGFPPHQRYFRNWLTEWSILDFKIDQLKKIVEEVPNRNFIMILDNSDASLEFAKKLKILFPHKISAIYLRQVIKKKTPENTIPFYTAFDIAIHEYTAGRMTYEQVIQIAQVVLNESNHEMILPSYVSCPTPSSLCEISLEEISLCEKMRKHLQLICSSRMSP